MILPNFLIVGAQKAGTTSLHSILAQHPQANMSEVKEINFFINKSKFEKGLEHYSSFFKNIESKAVGESSPGYLCHPGVPEMIYDSLGNIKIIILIREPIKRALSQYWDNRRHLSEWMSEQEILENCLESKYMPGKRGYFSRGVYAPQVKCYFDLFGQENVKVVFLEELIKFQKKELKNIYFFLGLDEEKGLTHLPPASNASQIWKNELYTLFFKKPSLSKFLPKKARRFLFFGAKENYKYPLPSIEVLTELNDFYRSHNKKLEELLDRKLPWD